MSIFHVCNVQESSFSRFHFQNQLRLLRTFRNDNISHTEEWLIVIDIKGAIKQLEHL
jgi:hypothetical protein